MKKKCLLLAGIGLVAAAVFLWRSGYWLVVNRPEKSDVIVVLAGDDDDVRYWHALQLLRGGYGQYLLLDASSDWVKYGRRPADAAADFVRSSAGDLAARAGVCPIQGDATFLEAKSVGRCLEPLRPRSVLLVTSDYHTRRALSILSHELPQYHWSVAAARDPVYGERWWQHRAWAKLWFSEWQRTIWWNLVDRWR